MRIGDRAAERIRAAWTAAASAHGYTAMKARLRRRGVYCFHVPLTPCGPGQPGACGTARSDVRPRGLKLVELALEYGYVEFWARSPQSLVAAIQRAHCELLAEEIHST